MTHQNGATRSLDVHSLARVEGEGALHVTIVDGALTSVQLNIYEPPRFFEAFLQGRAYTEPPDITARICGICPVAYQMSACLAIEDACGVTVGGQLADLRRLLYCGEWIESHALHIYMLHAPDFLGYDGAISLARDHRAIVERGLRLKKVGNRILEVVGGRAIHPINVRVGGFYRLPDESQLAELVPELEWARQAALDTVEWVAGFPIPSYEGEWELVALAPDGDSRSWAAGSPRRAGGWTSRSRSSPTTFTSSTSSTAMRCMAAGTGASTSSARSALQPQPRRTASRCAPSCG